MTTTPSASAVTICHQAGYEDDVSWLSAMAVSGQATAANMTAVLLLALRGCELGGGCTAAAAPRPRMPAAGLPAFLCSGALAASSAWQHSRVVSDWQACSKSDISHSACTVNALQACS